MGFFSLLWKHLSKQTAIQAWLPFGARRKLRHLGEAVPECAAHLNVKRNFCVVFFFFPTSCNICLRHSVSEDNG